MLSVVQREIVINKSSREVYQIISNLHLWKVWSPWMHVEPTAKSEVTGVANENQQILTWKGDVIGEGRMTILNLKADKQVLMKLEFLAPWRSVAESEFEITAESYEHCTVTWTMRSELPLYMVFFKTKMEAMMDNDFERGLVMLKELAEAGSLSSSSIYQGEKPMDGFQVIGQRMQGQVSELPKVIPRCFADMNALIERGTLEKPKVGVTLTHEFDHAEGMCTITVGYAYPLGRPIEVPAGYKLTQYPEHKGIVVDHYGSYRHLRNPWAMASAYQRWSKKKVEKLVPCYELYLIVPNDRELETLTQIVVPIK